MKLVSTMCVSRGSDQNDPIGLVFEKWICGRCRSNREHSLRVFGSEWKAFGQRGTAPYKELVRSLDEAAFTFKIAPNGLILQENDPARNLMMLGASTALAPSPSLIKDDPDGVPWERSNLRRSGRRSPYQMRQAIGGISAGIGFAQARCGGG